MRDILDEGLEDEKEEKGKETLEIAGKKYDCEWTKYTGKTNIGVKLCPTVTKIWFCNDKPMGIVRMEVKADDFDETMVMTGFGKEK